MRNDPYRDKNVRVYAIIIFILFSRERQVIINRDRRHIRGNRNFIKVQVASRQ